MNQIQIHFEDLGVWDKFTLTALWWDEEGFSCRKTYEPHEIPAECQPVLADIFASIVGLEEPWQATHVVANYQPHTPATDDGVEEKPEAVLLSVDARRKTDGAFKLFTHNDYAAFILTSEAVIEVFKNLTHMN